MNKVKTTTIGKLAAIGLLLWSGSGQTAGLMMPANSQIPALEIREHHVEVVIEDGYAITQIEQVFFNPNPTDLEAIYSFPIPVKAAVGEFTFWIDGKPVTGEVLEKEKARKIYQQEKQAGRETAITEQDGYKTFDISVSPVRANQDVKIRLSYVQAAHIDTLIGRYVYPLEEGGVDEEKLAFWNYNDAVKERFSFKLLFRSSYPIDQIRLPQHPQAVVNQLSDKEWTVSMVNESSTVMEEQASQPSIPSVVHNLNQDIVVYWRHQQGLPGSVDLITYKPDGSQRGTFMMTVTPGDDLAAITEGRDWIFILDYSGSMKGKYQSLIDGVGQGLQKLDPNDRFRIILFNKQASELTTGYITASADNVSQYIKQMEASTPNGGTNLYAGLKKGLKSIEADRSSAIILVTDGVANVGITEKKEFIKLLDKKDVRLFTFVMGNSANRPLLEGMAKVSNGFAMSVSNSDDILGRLMEATSKLTHQAFHDVDVSFSGVKVKDVTPQKTGSLYRGEQLVVFGHYWGSGPATVDINGKVSGVKKTYTTAFDFPDKSELYPEIERLWAYASIEDLQNQIDYFGKDADLQSALTDMAVEYSLVTDYTSMVVLREDEFINRGIDRRNAKRVAIEQKARQARQSQSVRNHRVDQQQPMYQNSAASHKGSGSFGVWMLILLIPLLGKTMTRNQKTGE